LSEDASDSSELEAPALLRHLTGQRQLLALLDARRMGRKRDGDEPGDSCLSWARSKGTLRLMMTMIAQLYEALKAAGAPEDKAQAAGKALDDHERRFDRIDGKLAALEAQVTMVKWITARRLPESSP
jgi:hypothetical protein